MISISERLRARQEPVGDGKGTWRKDGLCQEAADTIDALVAALEGLVSDCEEYARINNLHNDDGSPATNHAMRMARDALAKTREMAR